MIAVAVASVPKMPEPKTIRLQQLVIAPWDGDKGRTYSTLGLGEDGVVYRYDPHCEAWIAWPMTVASCRLDRKTKR
jgi:hypothetical protein